MCLRSSKTMIFMFRWLLGSKILRVLWYLRVWIQPLFPVRAKLSRQYNKGVIFLVSYVDLNEPTTSEECIQQETNILAAIIVSGAVILLVVGFSIYFLCYKYNKYHLKKQKTVTQATAEGSQWLQASQEPREDINDA